MILLDLEQSSPAAQAKKKLKDGLKARKAAKQAEDDGSDDDAAAVPALALGGPLASFQDSHRDAMLKFLQGGAGAPQGEGFDWLFVDTVELVSDTLRRLEDSCEALREG
jgi:hypothetical protein